MSALRLARARDRPRAHPQVRGLLPRPRRRAARRGRAAASRRSASRARRACPRRSPRSRVTAPYNDLGAVARRSSRAAAREIACVIVEPVAGNMGCVPPRAGLPRRAARALRPLRRAPDLRRGDDRLPRRAAAARRRSTACAPDLTCLGKVVGGGLPAAAYGGPRRAAWREIAPDGPVYQAGTLSGNPLAMAAGLATLEQLAQARRLRRRSTRARRDARPTASPRSPREAGVELTTAAVGGMFGFFFHPGPVRSFDDAKKSNAARFRRFFHAMLEAGVYLAPVGLRGGLRLARPPPAGARRHARGRPRAPSERPPGPRFSGPSRIEGPGGSASFRAPFRRESPGETDEQQADDAPPGTGLPGGDGSGLRHPDRDRDRLVRRQQARHRLRSGSSSASASASRPASSASCGCAAWWRRTRECGRDPKNQKMTPAIGPSKTGNETSSRGHVDPGCGDELEPRVLRGRPARSASRSCRRASRRASRVGALLEIANFRSLWRSCERIFLVGHERRRPGRRDVRPALHPARRRDLPGAARRHRRRRASSSGSRSIVPASLLAAWRARPPVARGRARARARRSGVGSLEPVARPRERAGARRTSDDAASDLASSSST